MDRLFKIYLEGMIIEPPQISGEMVLFPLKSKEKEGPDYITLSEAIEKDLIEITEVSAGGSVPELKATNKGKEAVLILDGEEIIGAKQNRVLNTTIMIGPESTIIIPVSCVERGRWSGHSLRMEKSKNFMMFSTRFKKVKSVDLSLERERQFRADQMAIWDDIAYKAMKLEVFSPTEAMEDIYDFREKDLEAYIKPFKLIPEQKGLLVFIGNKAAGLDFVSREKAFAQLYQKLLRSYAIEALIAESEENDIGRSRKRKGETNLDQPNETWAKEFLMEAARCEEKRFPSVGLGISCRYRGKRIIGAGLEVDSSIPHLAFFSLEEGENFEDSFEGEDSFIRFSTRKKLLFSR